jgi:hypothetical protein
MHNKSTGKTKKITQHLQCLETPYQIRAVRRFGEYRRRENEIRVLARQRSQQLWHGNPQFCAIPGVNIGSGEYWGDSYWRNGRDSNTGDRFVFDVIEEIS